MSGTTPVALLALLRADIYTDAPECQEGVSRRKDAAEYEGRELLAFVSRCAAEADEARELVKKAGGAASITPRAQSNDDPTNDERAQFASAAIDASCAAYGTARDPLPSECDLSNLLSNLRHYCDKHRLDFGAIDKEAYRNYAEERS